MYSYIKHVLIHKTPGHPVILLIWNRKIICTEIAYLYLHKLWDSVKIIEIFFIEHPFEKRMLIFLRKLIRIEIFFHLDFRKVFQLLANCNPSRVVFSWLNNICYRVIKKVIDIMLAFSKLKDFVIKKVIKTPLYRDIFERKTSKFSDEIKNFFNFFLKKYKFLLGALVAPWIYIF